MNLPPPLPSPKLHRQSVWQLILSILGLALTLFTIAGISVITLLAKSNSEGSTLNVTQLSKYIWVLLLASLITLPSIIYSIRRLNGKISDPTTVGNKQLYIASALILVWVGCLLTGARAEAWGLPSVLVSFINIAIVLLPTLFWITIGRFKLVSGSRQRAWGVINLSVFFTAPFITFVEIILIALVTILGLSSLMKNPELLPYFQLFQNQGQLDQTALNSLIMELKPILNQPAFYLLVGLMFSVLVPVIEELFKPLAVWVLAGRQITPAEGWSAGLLCGAAFGLIESLSLISVATSDIWMMTAIARVGTGLLHIFTAGLSGYALAKTWQDRHFLRISLVYLGVIALHGCWNFFAILMGLGQVAIPISVPAFSGLISVSTWVLGSLALLMAAGILVINYLLRKQPVPPVLPVVQAEPEEHSVIPS